MCEKTVVDPKILLRSEIGFLDLIIFFENDFTKTLRFGITFSDFNFFFPI